MELVETVGMSAAVRESESGAMMVSPTEMAVAATEMPSMEMAAAVVATTVAATSAKCHTRHYGREHNDGNPDP